MATATSSATMAAAGFEKKSTANTASLPTPGSGTFPSELLSPMVSTPAAAFVRKDDALRTPITPPSAYLDFLKNFSPAVQSPASATSAKFSFGDKSFDRPFDRSNSDPTGTKSNITPPTSQPSLSRHTSYDSNGTDASAATISSAVARSNNGKRPESPRVIIPPSPFAKPAPRSARTPRRLHIPQSPFSPALASAQSVPSPYSNTPMSAAPWSASFSPREPHTDIGGPSGKVHVRHVVTRTVTYCRTPLDPAPKGKRRKIEAEDDVSSSKASSEEPTPSIKQERIETIDEESSASGEASGSASEA
ncbi:hypothetical protein CB0940_11581 [Cercospora beticola]|uniref:Uncharacterized protein n=2 Tax=Cercospora beticola TaxID=122368 RepID=A0A2G5HD84_CERBT|nr:hypothetical protein CB0940_11581 [Cercospora beticola]PIA90488.1 hypothetical protein CB0940_11581 [Cercospora beticola]CAK1367639.1 unnamed protein product [Cercospora beticola]